jgi:hypothetical protein
VGEDEPQLVQACALYYIGAYIPVQAPTPTFSLWAVGYLPGCLSPSHLFGFSSSLPFNHASHRHHTIIDQFHCRQIPLVPFRFLPPRNISFHHCPASAALSSSKFSPAHLPLIRRTSLHAPLVDPPGSHVGLHPGDTFLSLVGNDGYLFQRFAP